MAKRIASAQKRARQSAKRRLRNRKQRAALKDKLKQLEAAGKEDALELLPQVQAAIDKSARRGVIHRNAASRLKSRLAREAAAKD